MKAMVGIVTSNHPNFSTDWTHPSVKQLAKGRDPIAAVSEAARHLVLQAFDLGWSGPPYDPFELARLLKIPIRPASLRVDARTVPDPDSGDLVIEYNPSRPMARVRFSVAHEIGHLLFDDVADQIRQRTAGGAVSEWSQNDDWQLEVLCNVAAAEILMPAQSLREMEVEYLEIDHLLNVRSRLQVSTEALFRRVASVIDRPVTMFAAQQTEVNGRRTIHVDYRVDSPAGPAIDEWTFPPDSEIWDMSAVGHTMSTSETLGSADLHKIEAVAVPPHPGQSLPRVVGLILNASKAPESDPNFREIAGDLFPLPDEGKQMVLHLVTDGARKWNGAFAKSLQAELPDAARQFEEWASSRDLPLELGQAVLLDSLTGPAVCCLVAQEGYGASSAPRIRYEHLAAALDRAGEFALELEADVHAPAIGTGQGGGHWPIIRDQMIRSIARRGIRVSVHHIERSR